MPHPVDIHVGSKIREARKMRGLSQTALGRRLGLSFQQIQKYESGANRVGASRLWTLSNELKVPLDSFFEGIDDRPTRRRSSQTQSGLAIARQIESINDRETRAQLKALIRSICKSSI
jgi:transcriptional regulator with XRE-family HTH domain